MLIKEICSRRAVRSYKPNPVPEAMITEIIKAAQFAPTAHNNRSVEFIVIKDPKTKQALFKLLDQEFLTQAPVLLVPVIPVEKSVAAVQDLSLASQNIFLQAAGLGLGTVWKNIYKENLDPVRKLLGLPDKFLLVNIIPVGFPKELPPPHDDKDFDAKKIHREKW